MGGCWHNVRTEKRRFHHFGVKLRIVAAVSEMARENSLIDCIQQRPCTASKIGNQALKHMPAEGVLTRRAERRKLGGNFWQAALMSACAAPLGMGVRISEAMQKIGQ